MERKRMTTCLIELSGVVNLQEIQVREAGVSKCLEFSRDLV